MPLRQYPRTESCRPQLIRRSPADRSFAVPASQCLRARAHRNIPSGESDESSGEVIAVRDPTHPLFGRTFHVIRRSVHRGGGFPISYEVEYRDKASLLIPVAATEPQNRAENRTKLSVEALHDLTSLVEQFEHHADQSERPLDDAASGTAAPNRRRGRRSSGGGLP